jgi:hypothetical protein
LLLQLLQLLPVLLLSSRAKSAFALLLDSLQPGYYVQLLLLKLLASSVMLPKLPHGPQHVSGVWLWLAYSRGDIDDTLGKTYGTENKSHG